MSKWWANYRRPVVCIKIISKKIDKGALSQSGGNTSSLSLYAIEKEQGSLAQMTCWSTAVTGRIWKQTNTINISLLRRYYHIQYKNTLCREMFQRENTLLYTGNHLRHVFGGGGLGSERGKKCFTPADWGCFKYLLYISLAIRYFRIGSWQWEKGWVWQWLRQIVSHWSKSEFGLLYSWVEG